MNSKVIQRSLFFSGILYFISFAAFPQSSAIKNAEAAVTAARARVEMNEQKVIAADSIINAGKRLIDESKNEMKAVDTDSRKLEKEYASKRKPINKLTNSKDKATANKARADLRAMDAQYKTDNRALESRLREALRKQTAAVTNIQKGRTARKNALEALKDAEKALKSAQSKLDNAASQKNHK